ncbi:MAG: hypothetical protein IKG80_05105, partial [Clostridia bacterium]|nr:hypothetical protein [Clostridia bacterium]
MNKDKKDDILLERAFGAYCDRMDEALSNDERLREEFPPNDKDRLNYLKTVRKRERTSSALTVLRRVASIIMAVISVTFCALMVDKNVRAAVTGTFVRWTSFYRTLNKSWDHDVFVTFDQDENKEFFKDVGLFDLNIGYVPEG